MRQLLDNPILKSNPGCLGGLLESVAQGHFPNGASGSVASQDGSVAPLKPGDAPMYVRPAAAEPVEPGPVDECNPVPWHVWQIQELGIGLHDFANEVQRAWPVSWPKAKDMQSLGRWPSPGLFGPMDRVHAHCCKGVPCP